MSRFRTLSTRLERIEACEIGKYQQNLAFQPRQNKLSMSYESRQMGRVKQVAPPSALSEIS